MLKVVASAVIGDRRRRRNYAWVHKLTKAINGDSVCVSVPNIGSCFLYNQSISFSTMPWGYWKDKPGPRYIFNKRLAEFEENVNANTNDFTMNDNQWDTLRKEILDQSRGLAPGLDYTIMKAVSKKPDLSLSYYQHIKKKGVVNIPTKIQFCINCAYKYEDPVVEVIEEMKTSKVFDDNKDMKILFSSAFIKTVAETREWRTLIKPFLSRPLAHGSYDSGWTSSYLSSFAIFLKAALKHKDFETFFEIWNGIGILMRLSGDISTAIFQGWEEGHYPLDLLFEVTKLIELPFTQNEAEKIQEYCRNEWNDVVDVDASRVTSGMLSCNVCNGHLQEDPPIDMKIFEEMCKAVKNHIVIGENIYKTSHPEEFEGFMKFIEKEKPFDIVVDSLNIRPHWKRTRYGTDCKSFDFLKDLYFNHGLRILFIDKTASKQQERMWSRFAYSFSFQSNTNDDVYTLLAACMSGPYCYILTNDNLRDSLKYIEQPLRSYFDKWIDQRRIFFHQERNRPVWPAVFKWTTQETKESWHVPYRQNVRRDNFFNHPIMAESRGKDFICLRKKNYTPSKECQLFREAVLKYLQKDSSSNVLHGSELKTNNFSQNSIKRNKVH
ncbi:hypothetical protein ACF0H5_002116 [Mactra antiquata]